jgi:glycosyltransferase involved in cell wall biosynthesis
LANLRRLGIHGDFDPETGHCDYVNVATSEQQWVQHAVDWHNSVPDGMRHCYANHKKMPNIPAILDATKCRLLACHTTISEPGDVEAAAVAYPSVKFWIIYHGSQASRGVNQGWMKNQRLFLDLSRRLPNVWYGTPEPTAPFAEFGYDRFLTWPNTIPFKIPETPAALSVPPVLLIAGRGDVIKARATAVLAAGLVAKKRPITLAIAVNSNAGPLDDLAAAVGITVSKQPYRSSAKFREYLRGSVAVVLNATMTEAMQYVGLDALSQGRPVVGSQTIRYLPPEWQADPNDPADIARVAMMFLDDYERYSAEALRLGCEIRDRQREAYHAAIAKILGS